MEVAKWEKDFSTVGENKANCIDPKFQFWVANKLLELGSQEVQLSLFSECYHSELYVKISYRREAKIQFHLEDMVTLDITHDSLFYPLDVEGGEYTSEEFQEVVEKLVVL